MAHGRRIDVGGRHLYYEAAGSGSPTVLFESGIECGAQSLAILADGVKQFTRTLVYDRAGLGQSDPAPTPRTSQDIVNDLRMLLTQAQINGPYLLVGHSHAGLPLRLFTHRYRHEVAGLGCWMRAIRIRRSASCSSCRRLRHMSLQHLLH